MGVRRVPVPYRTVLTVGHSASSTSESTTGVGSRSAKPHAACSSGRATTLSSSKQDTWGHAGAREHH